MNFFKLRVNLALLGGLLLGILSCSSPQKTDTAMAELTRYINPYIGTGGHGHVFLGANVPFGFVQLGPTQHTKGWDWCSGYHYSDTALVGFSHMHLSGTGIGDLGDITFFPTIDDRREHKFEHKHETVKPGFYSVNLPEIGISVELAATARTGFHRYLFPKDSDAQIIIDLKRGIGWDAPAEGYLIQENDTVVSGYRYSKGWAKDQKVYFTAVFSRPVKEFKVSEDDKKYVDGKSLTAKEAFAKLSFDATQERGVCVKVGLSPTSIENARKNLQAEQDGWNIWKITDEATAAWNKQLNKVTVETDNETDKGIFYTALFHSMTAPSVFSDVDADFTEYTTLSLWDTYRAAHPLATIIHPELMSDYAKTFLAIFNRQGKLPVWHLVGNETDCMIGNPGVPVLADMVLKGFDVDNEAAFEAMKASAMLDERGMKQLKEYGYIPYDKDPEHETVAKGLEYALADWSIAQVAKKLGKTNDYEYFLERSKSYRHYFDKEKQFMRGISADKKFREPFSPFRSTHRNDDYTEGNAWQYTWLVPHDIKGLVDLFGSEEAFTAKLDSLFIVEGDLGEEASPDISGLIGQYAHGNEPSHHITYMYPYVGQPWKTAEKVREILTTLYFYDFDGLSGNEDVGQMSSWYIMSALGFYQVAPAGGIYAFGSPLFDKATIKVGDEKTFQVIAHGNNRENIYIQSAKLNGKEYTKSYITHDDIVSGGVLEFTMGNKPSDTWGVKKEDRPY